MSEWLDQIICMKLIPVNWFIKFFGMDSEDFLASKLYRSTTYIFLCL